MKTFRRSSFRLAPHSLFVVLISLSPLLLVSPAVVYAQWEPDVRLTYNDSASYTSWNNARYIVPGPGSLIHVFWSDTRDGNGEIYYKRSTDKGTTWSSDVRLTQALNLSHLPAVAQSGGILHLVWADNRSGNDEIFYKRSSDSGTTWDADFRLAFNSRSSTLPAVASSDSMVHVVWMDYRDGNYEIYYKRSTDSGISWAPDERLTIDTALSQYPSVCSSGPEVHLVWFDSKAGTPEVFYRRSTDEGASWQPDTLLTVPPDTAAYPCISASGETVCVVWHDFRDGFPNSEVYFKRSTNAGLTWFSDSRLTFSTGVSQCPSLFVSGSNIHVAWEDRRTGNSEVFYKRSQNGGMSWESDVRLTYASGYSWYVGISAADSCVFLVWDDTRDGNYEVYFKRNPTGNLPSGVEVQEKRVQLPTGFIFRPNPFTSFTTFQGHSSERFALYDISGRKVGVYKGDRIGEGLSAGVYFLRPEGKDVKPLRVVKIR